MSLCSLKDLAFALSQIEANLSLDYSTDPPDPLTHFLTHANSSITYFKLYSMATQPYLYFSCLAKQLITVIRVLEPAPSIY